MSNDDNQATTSCLVRVPVSGYVDVWVTKQETEERTLQEAVANADFDIKAVDNDTEIGEFNTYQYIIKGNVIYAPCYEAHIIDEVDDA